MTLTPFTAETAVSWLQSLPEEELVLLYKHSPRCGVSLDAAEAVAGLSRQEPTLPIYQLDIIRQRAQSQQIARALGIPHASPQVILLRGPRPVWHTSHQRIHTPGLVTQIELARRDAAPRG